MLSWRRSNGSGVFWESINFASLKQLPILFICENNEYAIYSHLKKRMYKSNIVERVRSFGLEAKKIKNDTFTIFEETKKFSTKSEKIQYLILLKFQHQD